MAAAFTAQLHPQWPVYRIPQQLPAFLHRSRFVTHNHRCIAKTLNCFTFAKAKQHAWGQLLVTLGQSAGHLDGNCSCLSCSGIGYNFLEV